MSTKPRTFQAPKGTRDFYPEELLRRRYIAETWRAVSIRHGFEEIDGPTFEHADLYTVKSGEGILSELFSFRREGGDDLYALRPEFTPTLARMYAARARQLPSPTRWFCIPNFFRAENPQRGRLREFFQWNVDVLGDADRSGAADVIATATEALIALGLTPVDARIHANDRTAANEMLLKAGVEQDRLQMALSLLDRRERMGVQEFDKQAELIGLDIAAFEVILEAVLDSLTSQPTPNQPSDLADTVETVRAFFRVIHEAEHRGLNNWVIVDPNVFRGLAYYTGTVFEVIAEGERAIAGGGRYDNLVELFGGPPTPACGFGMGDVVLSLVLEDRGLMPKGMAELQDAVECVTRSYAMRPDAFVFSNGDEQAEQRVVPLLAELRRGVEAPEYQGKPWRPERYAIRPLHARTTGKATRNVGKLMKDAASANARYAVILESGEHCTLKNLDTGDEHKNTPIENVARLISG